MMFFILRPLVPWDSGEPKSLFLLARSLLISCVRAIHALARPPLEFVYYMGSLLS